MAATSAAQRLRQIADEIRCLPEAFDDPRDIASEGGLRLYEAIELGGFAEYAVLRVRADWRKKHEDRDFAEWGDFHVNLWGEAMRLLTLGVVTEHGVPKGVAAACGPIADLIDAEAAKMEAADGTPAEEPAGRGQGKRSTVKGEARTKIIAALTLHHKYQDGSCLNLEPIGNNELARLTKVDQATTSAFFKQKFGGHVKYRATCGDAGRLVVALKLLRGEYSPLLLYGGKPPGEGEHDDEE